MMRTTEGGGAYLIKLIIEAVWLGDCIGNFMSQFLLFRDFGHQIINVVHTPLKHTEGIKLINVVNTSTSVDQRKAAANLIYRQLWIISQLW